MQSKFLIFFYSSSSLWGLLFKIKDPLNFHVYNYDQAFMIFFLFRLKWKHLPKMISYTNHNVFFFLRSSFITEYVQSDFSLLMIGFFYVLDNSYCFIYFFLWGEEGELGLIPHFYWIQEVEGNPKMHLWTLINEGSFACS